MASIELQDIKSSYDERVILKIPSLRFEAGERVAAVGPSGSGKSTLLRTIAGLTPPTSTGRMFFDGVDVSKLSTSDRNIGFVFQDFALYPHLSVFDNLALCLRFVRSRQDGSALKRKSPKYRESLETRIVELASRFEISHLLERRPTQISGGQQQRVAIARALIRGATLNALLLDEPLSDLDGQLRMRTRDELIRHQEKFGTTLVHVTHDRYEAMALGNRILVLRDGAVEQFDTPAKLYLYPRNSFVASFMGEFSLNTYPCIVEHGRLRFAGIDLRSKVAFAPQGTVGITLGFRPETVRSRPLEASDSLAEGRIAVTALRIEPLGSRSLVHGRLPAEDMVQFVVESRIIESGTRRFEIDFDSSPILIFDAEGVCVR